MKRESFFITTGNDEIVKNEISHLPTRQPVKQEAMQSRNGVVNPYTFKVKTIFLVLMAIGITALFQSCRDDDEGDTGTPSIKYIRLTDPAVSDSLIARAFLGNTIAIVGSNLQDVVEVWFNDQSSRLNTNFITGRVIIVTIPNEIPEVVTNEIRMVTRGGQTYSYPFRVDVPAPVLASMRSEHVPDAGIAVLNGNFFIDDENVPLEVFFPGNIKADVLSVNVNRVEARVPNGAGVGPITMRTIYGSSRSTFYFRDDRNIFLDFDNLVGAGWRSGNRRATNPNPIDGNFLALDGTIGHWGWQEDNLAMNLWGAASGRPVGPLFPLGNNRLEDMVLKFEVNVVNPWSVGYMQLIFTPYALQGTNAYYSDMTLGRALWRPWEESGTPFVSNGWITVTIPLTEFRFNHNAQVNNLSLSYPEAFGGFTIFVWGPALGGEEASSESLLFAVDNIRVVPR